jgi:RNA polymerase sigma-70 factor, ECF subfamily
MRPPPAPFGACMVAVLATADGRALMGDTLARPSPVRPRSGGDASRSVAVARVDDADAARDELDSAVLRRAKRGDREAFVRLMDHYDRRLRSLAFRLLDDRDEAVDAMQDVYVKAFGALPGFREKSSVGTWLYRITYTTCCEHLRQRRRGPIPYADDAPPASSRLGRDPADEATLHADLAVALRSLSPEARAAVLLVDRDGYDYRTAAAVLAIPEGTLASRLSAAHAVLRRALRGEEASP